MTGTFWLRVFFMFAARILVERDGHAVVSKDERDLPRLAVSLVRSDLIETKVGSYSVHHMPELFGGFECDPA